MWRAWAPKTRVHIAHNAHEGLPGRRSCGLNRRRLPCRRARSDRPAPCENERFCVSAAVKDPPATGSSTHENSQADGVPRQSHSCSVMKFDPCASGLPKCTRRRTWDPLETADCETPDSLRRSIKASQPHAPPRARRVPIRRQADFHGDEASGSNPGSAPARFATYESSARHPQQISENALDDDETAGETV